MTNEKKKEKHLIANSEALAPEEFLKTDTFIPPAEGVSHVALCLSGGSSRSCIASMGQLRALKHLTHTKDGKSLLEKTRLISSVSGGSWIAVPFTYLGKEVSDDLFLNRYVSNPHDLRLKKSHSDENMEAVLSYLPPENIGSRINSRKFSPEALAAEALLLHTVKKVPTDLLWQTLIGEHLLKPYNLYSMEEDGQLSQIFSYDENSLQKLKEMNPQIESCHLVTPADATHARRPFLVCNMALFVDNGEPFATLAPVQATPFFTGIPSLIEATDANGLPVGDGGITSFGFGSLPQVPGSFKNSVQLTTQRPLSLMDITGTSSACIAAILEEEMNRQISRSRPGPIENMIPRYIYWSTNPIPFGKPLIPSRFADGGCLENLGIAAALSYTDIDRVITCINTATALEKVEESVLDIEGNPISKGALLVTEDLPPLFGYQPYQEGIGYQLYEGCESPCSPQFRYNQLFPSEAFVELMEGFEKQYEEGNAIYYLQSLPLKDNSWFRVKGGKEVHILWNYLSDAPKWHEELRESVKEYVSNMKHFPNYSTLFTYLNAEEINLLANFTGWSLACASEALMQLYD